MRCRVGELGFGLEVLGGDLVGRSAVQHALAPGVVGLVEAAQQLFQGTVRVDVDAQHLGADTAVEALHHAIRLRRAWLCVTVLGAKAFAGLGESRGEAAAVIGQHVGKPERECRGGFAQEGDGTSFGFVVLDREVVGARVAVNGDEQVSLAPFAVAGLQFEQVLDVGVDEAKVIVAEGALALCRFVRGGLGPAVQPFGLEGTPDAVTVEVRRCVTTNVRSSSGKLVTRRRVQTMARSSSVAFQGSQWRRAERSRQPATPRLRHLRTVWR